MEPCVKKALAKALEAQTKKERDDLVAGQEYNFDQVVSLRVAGRLRVGEDHDHTPTAEIPLKATLALFVRYCGVTGDAALAALERAMTEAVALSKDAASSLREVADLDAAEGRVLATLAKLPKVPRKGAVTVKATVTELSAEDVLKDYFLRQK